MQFTRGMQQPEPTLLLKTERPKSVRCSQCGDSVVETASSQLLATRTEKVLCRDCAFDQLPCTD
jgi:formylmethanofuran dehydrogenase subunit E